MAHLTVALRFTLAAAIVTSTAGCYADHSRWREPPPAPAVDAGVSSPDAPAEADAPAEPDAACLDCSCCTCGRPSTGAICPLIGLPECCVAPAGIEVDAAISSATLGDDCSGGAFEDCAFDGCGCAQTGVQLNLGATGAPAERAAIAVLSVRLVLMEDGAPVGELSPHALLVWSDEAGTYVAWDGSIGVGEDLHVRVDTSAPDWAAVGGGDAWRTYGMAFRVEVTLSVDGVERELTFEPVVRESDITT